MPQGLELIILCSFNWSVFDSSFLDPSCGLKFCHSIKIFVCKFVFILLPVSDSACIIVPGVSRVPTQIQKVRKLFSAMIKKKANLN